MESKEPEAQKPPQEGYPIHPFGQSMPEMTQDEFELFKKDIRQHGQLVSIDILDGMVLDGRHRQRACLELGITPKHRFLPEDTAPLKHMLSKNRFRRNLTQSQMAIAAVKVYLISHGLTWSGMQRAANSGSDFAQMQTAPLTQDEAARMFGISRRLFSQAMKLYEPDGNASASLKLAAEQGLLNVGDASGVVDEPGEVQDTAVELVLRGKAKTVLAAVRQVHRERDRAAVVETPSLEPWQSARATPPCTTPPSEGCMISCLRTASTPSSPGCLTENGLPRSSGS